MATLAHLSDATRKQLVRAGRQSGSTVVAFRCAVLASFGLDGSRRGAARRVGCAAATACDVVSRFARAGFDGLADRRATNGETKMDTAYLERLHAALTDCPLDFGWERPTWTRELLALEMARQGFALIAVCTVGRGLRMISARRGNPKPVVRCPWPPRKAAKVLRTLAALCEGSSRRAPVFHADEIDIHLNPKIGLDWMNQGHQRQIMTPGKNEKRYLAGARHYPTGNITYVEAEKKNSALFCRLLDQLCLEYPEAHRIHVVLDNYIIHSSKITQRHVGSLGGRVVLHFLPPYCPDHNRIERVWQDLHANVTRNHRCKTMDELMRSVRAFLRAYNRRHRLNPALRRAPIAA